ncbi:MAG: GNAT family N-acetyltransferase [Streptosporangiales bacterium]|nr:GNAT family N-acetyltransferase [Streptosporangiales bacterium]
MTLSLPIPRRKCEGYATSWGSATLPIWSHTWRHAPRSSIDSPSTRGCASSAENSWPASTQSRADLGMAEMTDGAPATVAATDAWPPPLRVRRMPAKDPIVRRLWRRLQGDGAVGTPFLTYEWCAALADVPESCPGFEVLVACRENEPVGLFPVEWIRADGRPALVGPAGWRWLAPDHMDAVAPASERPAVARALARHLRRSRDWDVADFQGLDAEGALASALRNELVPPHFVVAVRKDPSPVVVMGPRSDQELLPSRNLRQQVRRGLRVAERHGGGLSVVSDPETLPGLLEVMMRLHNARFGEASEVFATPARRRFHLLAARRMAAVGAARVYHLRSADGADAGLLYAFAHGPRLYYYSMGIAPDQAQSPGRTLLGQAVLHGAAEGFEEFDLLRGDHEYKRRFAHGERMDVTVRALRLTPRALAFSTPVLLRWLARRPRRSCR